MAEEIQGVVEDAAINQPVNPQLEGVVEDAAINQPVNPQLEGVVEDAAINQPVNPQLEGVVEDAAINQPVNPQLEGVVEDAAINQPVNPQLGAVAAVAAIIEPMDPQLLEDFSKAVELLLKDKEEHVKNMEELARNCEEISSLVLKNNVKILTMYLGALKMGNLVLPADDILMSSLACTAALLLFSHEFGWNKLNWQIHKYSAEYGQVSLIHTDGLKLARGILNGRNIFAPRQIPVAADRMITELIGAKAEISLVPTGAEIDPTVAVTRASEPAQGRAATISGVADTLNFKNHFGHQIRIYTSLSFVLLAGIGLLGVACSRNSKSS